MANACPAAGPDDPLVHSLLGVVDCNAQQLVRSGYAALFEGSGHFTAVLTVLLTLYVAFIGYRLMLGQSQLRVTDFVLSAVKIGLVLALATQWNAYQALVYRLLFSGPQQLADMLVSAVQPDQSSFRGDVFDGLQRAFDDLSGAANGFSSHAAPTTSPLLGGAGFGALLMTLSASVLLLSSLGVLMAAKIVLALLLAIGPIFIGLALFDSTRGLFEGWLRASLGFALAPLSSILLLAVSLTMLEPSLLQIEELRRRGVYTLGPAYSVATLILVFAVVSLGALLAGGIVAMGFRLPSRKIAPSAEPSTVTVNATGSPALDQPRALRIAAAAAAMERRDTLSLASASVSSLIDRRTEVASQSQRASGATVLPEARLGQGARRTVRPRTARATARSA
jgi:type IV secretion system protein VirB6